MGVPPGVLVSVREDRVASRLVCYVLEYVPASVVSARESPLVERTGRQSH